jgi:hypothetical protein
MRRFTCNGRVCRLREEPLQNDIVLGIVTAGQHNRQLWIVATLNMAGAVHATGRRNFKLVELDMARCHEYRAPLDLLAWATELAPLLNDALGGA